MKPRKKENWRPQLTRQEKRLGWVFFGLYLLVFPVLMGWIWRLLDNMLDIYFTAEAVSSAIYYAIVLLILVAAFWEFLRHAFRLFTQWAAENFFAILTGLGGFLVVTTLVGLVPLPVSNPVFLDYKGQFLLSPGSTILVVVFLRPAVEEILYRGLLFGSLRGVNRPLAYALSSLLFALGSVWQYAFPGGEWAYLLLALQYLPMGLALSWSYDNGGSVFSPITLRVIIQALGLTVILHI